MKDRTTVLVTHHIKLCLPVASMLVKTSNGSATIEKVQEQTAVPLDFASEMEDSEGTLAGSSTSKDKVSVTAPPVFGGLITKENRAQVCRMHRGCILALNSHFRGLSSGWYTLCISRLPAWRLGLAS